MAERNCRPRPLQPVSQLVDQLRQTQSRQINLMRPGLGQQQGQRSVEPIQRQMG